MVMRNGGLLMLCMILVGVLTASVPSGALADENNARDMGPSPVWSERNQSGPAQPTYSGPSQADIAAQQAAQQAQQQLNEAHTANQQGVAFYNNGDWARAVPLFEEAARKNPNDPVIRQNLANARAQLAARRAAEQERLRSQARDQVAVAGMQQSINNYVQSLNAAPAVAGGLDFDGINAGTPTGGGGLDFTSLSPTPGAARPAPALDFSDPMVVDARNVPSGLPPAVDNAIAGAYANAPAGVSDRVRKGFQAVMAHDWDAARAWFADALSRDPNNAALKSLLASAGYAVAAVGQTPRSADVRDFNAGLSAGSGSVGAERQLEMQLSQPSDIDMAFLFDPGYKASDVVDRERATRALRFFIATPDFSNEYCSKVIHSTNAGFDAWLAQMWNNHMTILERDRPSNRQSNDPALQLPKPEDINYLFPGLQYVPPNPNADPIVATTPDGR